MKCPFLKEMSVKYCQLCRLKMIPQTHAQPEDERCSSRDYSKCTLAQSHYKGMQPQERCPFLCEQKVQYCSASSVPKLIPCEEDRTSRCTGDGHRYCQLYLSLARPQVKDLPRRTDSGSSDGLQPRSITSPQRRVSSQALTAPVGVRVEYVEDIPVPIDLSFTPNHMWVDSSDGQSYYVGVDAFFVKVLGRVDQVSFPSHRGEGRPVVRFGISGVDFDLVFPSSINVTEINAHLTVDPSDLIQDPYGRGWLFEGIQFPGIGGDPDKNMFTGSEATGWMRNETNRIAQFMQDQHSKHHPEVGHVMQDGGWIAGNLAGTLDRAGLVRLHSEFFSLPYRH
ncbi:MAG: hypothetical protein KJ970_07075 [Candidatus Eisenbacteria bacterium]|uniref:Uncharacterized protein n=1 Tax=Eiseniibacteriota bacterium TaxID=2212470 RepID=A0A948RTN1_UNCEI|nr:hypothetical protein [Candidatus Eisenbacteria bacterium]MBU1949480.1 hypothetical protein [Candidatus Eisenbacteria bacterium]MBU2690675.1 hypothetical protein [Candidatus Eisenbacteria bacterium]